MILTKEKLASLKATKVAPSGTVPPVLESVPLSPTVPSDGRFAPRHSFSGPFGERKLIPYWEVGAGGVVEDKYLRLTPPKQSRTGFAWNNQIVEMTDWEILVEFHVQGRKDIGGDGFALWFVERPEILGNVYGSTDYWNGLGIFFDTFNNDGMGKNPLISAVFNDGTQKYDAASDGASQALESCTIDFRNQPIPSMAKLRFHEHRLELDLAIKRDATGQPMWQPCFKLADIELGVDKYFGVTAHTGDVADSHDIYRFEVHDLTPAQVDLQAVRDKYQQEMEHQHSEHEHGHKMTADEFQHEVLTLLQQIQGEVNMLETGQIEMQDWLSTMRDERAAHHETVEATAATAAANALGGGSGGGHDNTAAINAATSTLKSVSQTHHDSVKAELQAIKDAIHRSQAAQQAKVDELVSQMHRMQSILSSNANNQASAGVALPPTGGIDWFIYIVVGFTAICTLVLTIHSFQQAKQKDRWKLV